MTESAAAPAVQKTALHSRHLALGATMAPFAGWEMPLWYRAGAIREHLAVIGAAGLFDTGHMDVFLVAGEANRDFLDYAFTRNLDDLRPGRAVYGAFLNQSGHCIDDGIVYPMEDGRLWVVVNAGMGAPLLEHLGKLPGADAVEFRNPAPRLAKLDLQGPASPGILRRLLADAGEVLEKFPYFSFKGDFDFALSEIMLRDGTPILLSRTGYTGELGFELFVPRDRVGEIWDEFLAAGKDAGLLPCGLAARDSLRTGAVLPLSHQDIGPWPFINHPWSFALPLAPEGTATTFTKEFVGGDALDAAHTPYTLPFIGYDPRRVDPADAVVLLRGREAGRILTIVSDMAIGWLEGRVVSVSTPGLPEDFRPRGLACGFVRVDARLDPGTEIVLRDGRREIRAEICTDIRPDRGARRNLTAALSGNIHNGF